MSLHEFDYTRLFMACIIVLGHSVVFANYDLFGIGTTLFFNKVLCCLVVPFFYSLSGYFLLNKINNNQLFLSLALRMLKLYCVWSLLYLPIHFINMYNSTTPFRYAINAVISFFEGNFPLWYLLGGGEGIFLFLILFRLCRNNINIILIISFGVFIFGSIYRYNILLNENFYRSVRDSYGNYFCSDAFIKNGLFFGLPFLVLGAFISHLNENNRLPGIRLSVYGIIIFMIVGIVETKISFVISKYNWNSTGNQLKFFIYPMTFFLLSFLVSLSKITKAKDTKGLRKLSGLIFFLHYEILFFIKLFLLHIGLPGLYFNLLLGVFTIVFSYVLSYYIYKLSRNFRLLRILV